MNIPLEDGATDIIGKAQRGLGLDDAELAIKVTALPSREQIDTPVDEQLIVEYYSR